MKKIRPFILSVAVMALCTAVYFFSVRVGTGVNIGAGNVSRTEMMQGGDTVGAERIELYNGESIDINSADAVTLAVLPGIGKKLAEAIVEYREENGAFESIEDIMKVNGIGQGRFDEIRSVIMTKDTEPTDQSPFVP